MYRVYHKLPEDHIFMIDSIRFKWVYGNYIKQEDANKEMLRLESVGYHYALETFNGGEIERLLAE